MLFKRVIVVAPTRSTCVNLHYLIGLKSLPETLIQRECGAELKEAIAELPLGGFGIVAGTGTGKSAAIRQMCHEVMQKTDLSVSIVTQEHRSDAQTASCDVVVVTPGVAMMWAKNGSISNRDLIVLDEVHQTSEHLELVMAVLKRLGCTFVWMSATIDPRVYQEYLEARRVIECSAYDQTRRAVVEYHTYKSVRDVITASLPQFASSKRGVAVFVPTRELAQKLATEFDGMNGVHADFYHGGEPAEKLRPYIEGSVPRPYVVFMTAAGSSSLNISGLDVVVIDDEQYREVVQYGKRLLRKMSLDPNTILQMAGRVDGRAVGGEVHIVTDRPLDLRQLQPVAPSFVLGGDLELLAMTSARLGIDLRELSLIGSIDEDAYRATFDRLVQRGLISIEETGPRLTALGEKIEALPTSVAWGEVIVKAQEVGNTDLLTVMCLAACVGELYKLTGKKWSKYGDPCLVRGSDHLTGYNIVSQAIVEYGREDGRGYKLSNKLGAFCKKYGYSQKEIRNVALLFASLLQRLGQKLPLPTDFPEVKAGDSLHMQFVEVLAAVQSMSYLEAPTRTTFGNNQYGASDGYSVLGFIRHWQNSGGFNRATIEGTHIPAEVVKRYARTTVERVYGPGLRPGTVEVYARRTFAGVEIYGGGITEMSLGDLAPDVCDRYAPLVDAIRAQAKAAELRNAETARQMAELLPRAQMLRSEINALLRGRGEELSDALFDRLDVLDVDDEALPRTVHGLQTWCAEANQAFEAATHQLGKARAVETEVSASQLAELAARFRG